MNRKSFRDTFSYLFKFSPRERRGILFLLPILAVLAVVLAVVNKPRFETGLLERADAIFDGGQALPEAGADYAPGYDGTASSQDETVPVGELFTFDPNTVSLQELCRLGFSTRTAAGIIKYRERGKRFEIPEDFATCYGVSIEQYTRLEPYIRIGEEFRVRSGYRSGGNGNAYQRDTDGTREIRPSVYDTLRPFDPNHTTESEWVRLGFSPAQAAAIGRYRESIGGFSKPEDLARCYVVSDMMMDRLGPYLSFPEPSEATDSGVVIAEARQGPVELNRADSATMRSVSGIGEVLVVRIMDYRGRLGGFHSVEQLAEIPGMTEANYERVVKQIWVDSCEIQKIDINFADHKILVETLGRHPYMDQKTLRKILKERQLKGGWSSIGDMVEQNILSQKQAARLAPYLIFTTL